MQKIIFFFSLFFTHMASATNWGIETLLTPEQRPERGWMTHFSATPDIVAGASLSDAIESCSQIVGDDYCVVKVAQAPIDLPLTIFRSKTKLIGSSNMELTHSAQDALFQVDSFTHEVIIEGFNIRGGHTPKVSGIFVHGQNISHIAILNNKIHDFSAPTNAHGIAVYGTGNSMDASVTINNIIIEGNEIYNMQMGSSEGIAVNGNVVNWEIKSNYIHDVNNIAIDAVGGEGTAGVQNINGKLFPNEADAARYGFIENNIVVNMSTLNNPAYKGSAVWAAAIYIDGGHHIRIANNKVTNTPWAYEIGAENCVTSSNILLEKNSALNSHFGDLVFGGYALSGYKQPIPSINCDSKNTIDVNEGHGYVKNITIQNNIFSSVNTIEERITPLFRVTHAIISEPNISAINDQGDGSSSGDFNAIKTVSLQTNGDANRDGVVNIQDVIFVISIVLDADIAVPSADCSADNMININDVVCTINRVLN